VNTVGFYLKPNLRFFDETNRSEPATPKRRQHAREEGQVVKSREIVTAFSLIVVFFSLRILSGYMVAETKSFMRYCFGLVKSADSDLALNTAYALRRVALIAIPIMAVTVAVEFAASVAQSGWIITSKIITPNFSRLNPVTGFKRVFSTRAAVALFKSLLKFSVIAYIIYTVLKKEMNVMPFILDMPAMESAAYTGGVITEVGMKSGLIFLFIALADYIYEWRRHEKDIRMSKREIKEEYRQTEGDPQVMSRIRRRMREVSVRGMMKDMPKADVVITNPTHYAVALHYDKLKAAAPVVLAKGADYMAKRIKEAAIKHRVEIVENAELARALYRSVKIGKEIPAELYQAVAEVLAFVYRLRQ
jgi:flagellar biosynthetic protein FlhB